MFKEMAEIMTDDEVKRCMAILVDDSIVFSFSREVDHNSINVKFRVTGHDREKEFQVELMPDSFEWIVLDKDIKLRTDCEYIYEQFMIAKGYSEYWKGNMFVGE